MKIKSMGIMGLFAMGFAGVAIGKSFGGAAALSELYVSQVTSTTGGTEQITPYAMATQRHHTGNVQITTIERGYGNASATMNNGPAREIATQNLCDGGRGALVFCRNGQTIIGHARTWDVTGNGNGQFVVRSTSVNWPRNTLTKALSLP